MVKVKATFEKSQICLKYTSLKKEVNSSIVEFFILSGLIKILGKQDKKRIKNEKVLNYQNGL